MNIALMRHDANDKREHRRNEQTAIACVKPARFRIEK